MAERIAEGEVYVGLNDGDVRTGLERVEREFHSTMRDISNEEAVAKINADLAPLEDKLAKAKRKVRELEGQKATVKAGANTKELDRQLKNANRAVKRLDGKKATLEIELKGVEKALAAEKALDRADEKRVKAAEKRYDATMKHRSAAEAEAARSEKARLAQIDRAAKVSHSLRMQQERELLKAHSEGLAIDRERAKMDHDRTVGLARENAQIVRLQSQWSRLTDKAERLNKRRAYTTEGRAKLELDTKGVIADMLRVKAELNALGAHPPAKIKIDVDRKDFVGRAKGFFRTVSGTILEKASGLSDMTLRIGPFTASIKAAMTALAFLGPMLTDVVGAAGALIGVMGAGIAGAAAVGAGAITGLGMGFLGLKFSLRNVGSEFTNLRSYMAANQKAIEKYGKGSDEQIKTQDALNHALKEVSPIARNAAQGVERFYKAWDRNTKPTQSAFGNIAKGAFQALHSITPMWARQTNTLSRILNKNLSSAFNFIKGRGAQGLPGASEFKNDIKEIGDNFNHMLPNIMRGMGNLGRAFLNFGREGSKSFDNMGQAFENWTQNVLKFTQGDSFGATIKRWASDAGDLLHFFGALGRVITHFFGAGSTAGDSFLQTMTHALNRWDKFIQSTSGHNSIADFFKRAVSGTEALYSAFAPIVQLFALWSAGLSPAVKVITQIFAGVTKVAAALGKLVGLNNPWATLGATFGAMWAVGKISAFVSMLSRIPGILRGIAEAEGAFGVLKSLFNGKFLSTLKSSGVGTGIAAQIEAGATAGSVEFRSAIISGATVGAAEIRTAMATGGGIGGAENLVGNAIGGRGAVGAVERTGIEAVEVGGTAAAASKLGKVGLAATAARGAVAGLLTESALMTGGLTILGAAAVYAGYKIITHKNAIQQATESYQAYGNVAKDAANRTIYLGKTSYGLAQAQGMAAQSVRDSKKALEQTKPGTLAHRNAMLQYRASVMEADVAQQKWNHRVRDAELTTHKHTESLRQQLLAADKVEEEERKRQKNSMHPEENQKIINKALEHEKDLRAQMVASMNKEASTAANYARIWRGMPQLTEKAAQAVGQLARTQGGKDLSKTISVKYKTSSDVGKVSKAASSALASNVPKSVVTKITADSRNATENVRRLNAIKLTPKNLRIMESGGAKALARLRDLVGVKLAPKVQRILASDQDAHSKIKRLIALGIPPKVARIIGNDDDAKAKVREANAQKLRALVQMIGRIIQNPSNLFSMLPAVLQPIKRFLTGGKATGGVGADSPAANPRTTRKQDAAVARAVEGRITRMGPGQIAHGARISTPRAIYGEEPGSPEFVISTNPAYRKSNLGYLTQAARMLGVEMAAKGKGKNDLPGYKPAGSAGIGDLTAAGTPEQAHAAPKKPAVPKKFRKPSRKKAKHKRIDTQKFPGHPWTNHVNDLMHQEELWDQEVGFREGRLKEPDSYLIEKKDAKGNVVSYDIDLGAISNFFGQLTYVQQAVSELMKVILGLAQAIPNALTETTNEMSLRDYNIRALQGRISQDNDLAKQKYKKTENGHKKGEFTPDAKAAQKRLRKEQNDLQDERTKRGNAKDAHKTLIGESESNVFKYRETQGVLSDYNQQILDLGYTADGTDKQGYPKYKYTGGGKPGADQASQNASLAGGGGGGADTTLSYGAQAVLADTEKMDVIRQFSGNMQTASAYAQQMTEAIGGSASAAGAQVNAANMNPASGAAAAGPAGSGGTAAAAAGIGSDTAAGGAVASGGAAGAAMRSGSAAAGAVAAGSGAAAVGPTSAPAAQITHQEINVKPTFANVPPDPMPFARGVAFEIAGAL